MLELSCEESQSCQAGQWRRAWILVSVQDRIESDFGMVCMHIHGAKKQLTLKAQIVIFRFFSLRRKI